MRGVGLPFLCAVAACSGADQVTLSLPERAGSIRTAVLAYQGDASLRIEVHAAGEPIVLQRSGDFERITVLYLEDGPGDLGLEVGVAQEAPSDACRPMRLPPGPAFAWTPGAASFEPLDELPPAVRSFRYAGPCPCLELSVAQRIPVREAQVVGLVPRATSVLVVLGTRILEVFEDGRVEETPTPGLDAHAVFGEPGGDVWVGTESGVLLVGSPEAGFVPTSTRARPAAFDTMVGSRGGAPFELYTVLTNGDFLRFDDGEQWEVLYPGTGATTDQFEDLVWLGPGRAIAMQDGGEGPIHYDRGALTPLRVEQWDVLAAPPASLGHIEGLGTFMGTRTYDIYRFEDVDRWTALDNEHAYFGTVRDFLPLAGGFAFCGDSGRLGYFHSDVGFCVDGNIEENLGLRYLAPLGDRILAAGEREVDNALLILNVRPRE